MPGSSSRVSQFSSPFPTFARISWGAVEKTTAYGVRRILVLTPVVAPKLVHLSMRPRFVGVVLVECGAEHRPGGSPLRVRVDHAALEVDCESLPGDAWEDLHHRAHDASVGVEGHMLPAGEASLSEAAQEPLPARKALGVSMRQIDNPARAVLADGDGGDHRRSGPTVASAVGSVAYADPQVRGSVWAVVVT